MSVSAKKITKVVGANQFFNFVLKCFAFVCSVAIISVVSAIFGHVSIGGVGCFARCWDEVGMKCFVKKPRSRDT